MGKKVNEMVQITEWHDSKEDVELSDCVVPYYVWVSMEQNRLRALGHKTEVRKDDNDKISLFATKTYWG